MSDEAAQTGPSRLHVPGRGPAGAAPPGGQIVVKGPNGQPMSLPIVYVGAMDEAAAKQFAVVAEQACTRALVQLLRALAQTLLAALAPPPEAEPPDAEKGIAEAAREVADAASA